MSKKFKLSKDKNNGKFKMSYSYEMDDKTLQERKKHLQKSIEVYDYQIDGLTNSKALAQKELDEINTILK